MRTLIERLNVNHAATHPKVSCQSRLRQRRQDGWRRRGAQSRPQRGFTLAQMVLVLAIIGILAALLTSAFRHSRALAERAQCDAKLKAIVLALDAFRQEHGYYPEHLSELVVEKYIEPDELHCPADPLDGDSYANYYIHRQPRENNELPILLCPYHENDLVQGGQGFKGAYTTQFAVKPAVLNAPIGATVIHPDGTTITGADAMILHGGDRVTTGDGGSAVITFADTSTATLADNCDVTVLQSFISGQAAPLYTVLRQSLGNVQHQVNPGSKYDVVTPTSTAGALGTRFTLQVNDDDTTPDVLTVSQHKVYATTMQGTAIVYGPDLAPAAAHSMALPTHADDAAFIATKKNGSATKNVKSPGVPVASNSDGGTSPTPLPGSTPMPANTPGPAPTAIPAPTPVPPPVIVPPVTDPGTDPGDGPTTPGKKKRHHHRHKHNADGDGKDGRDD